jgi:hypothetical protein
MSLQTILLKAVITYILLLLWLLIPFITLGQPVHTNNIVFTSDAHYGITRKAFRGDTNVNGFVVNAAMIKAINTVPALTLPNDGGVDAGKQVGAVDYLLQTGDIANRMELPIQSSAASWAQFTKDYMHSVT